MWTFTYLSCFETSFSWTNNLKMSTLNGILRYFAFSACFVIVIPAIAHWLKKEKKSPVGVSYMDYISCRRVKLTRLQKKWVLGVTPNCIWWWGPGPVDLRCVEYYFISLLPGSLWPVVIVPFKVPSTSQIDLFKNYSYLIRILDVI